LKEVIRQKIVWQANNLKFWSNCLLFFSLFASHIWLSLSSFMWSSPPGSDTSLRQCDSLTLRRQVLYYCHRCLLIYLSGTHRAWAEGAREAEEEG